jgi:hypothetical protein
MSNEQRVRDRTLLVFTTVLLIILYLRVATHQGLALDGSAGILSLASTEEIKFLRGREFEEFINQIGSIGLTRQCPIGLSNIFEAITMISMARFHRSTFHLAS